MLGCTGNFNGTYGLTADDEGSDLDSFDHKSLNECKRLCAVTAGCRSFSFIASHRTFRNCNLKDKELTSSSTFVPNRMDYTTYYCVTDRKIIK